MPLVNQDCLFNKIHFSSACAAWWLSHRELSQPVRNLGSCLVQ